MFLSGFAPVSDIVQYCEDSIGAERSVRCFLFSCDPLMLSQTGSVTREAPLGISLTLLHTAAATLMNNK